MSDSKIEKQNNGGAKKSNSNNNSPPRFDPQLNFFSTLPKTSFDPITHANLLLERASTAKKFGPREATGGVLPVVRDPYSRETYFLLGMNHHGHYCHFHGWVDEGETQDQGAAREAYEESKAVLGDIMSLWRAVCSKGIFSQLIGRGGMHLINYGDMTEIEREEMVQKFAEAKAWSASSDEVKSVKWFSSLSFRHACLNRPDPKADVIVERDIRKNIKRRLRGWLADIFADPTFWQQPIMLQTVDKGYIPLAPIQCLPKIEDDNLLKTLPYVMTPY